MICVNNTIKIIKFKKFLGSGRKIEIVMLFRSLALRMGGKAEFL